MKNKVILSLLLMFLMGLQNLCSQNITNAGFESWEGEGMFVHPQGWTSSNDFSSPIGFQGVYYDSKAFEGLLAAKIITTNIGFAGAPYAGFIVNGKMNVIGHHDIDSIYKAGEPFTGRPDALSGYYKFSSGSLIEDWGHAFVILKRYDSISKKVDTIGFGSNTLLNPSEEYRHFIVPVEYFNDYSAPDSIVVAFFSTYPNHPLSGGELWIDGLSLEYATSNDPVISGTEFRFYPNPAGDFLNFSGPLASDVIVYNIKGEKVLEEHYIKTLNLNSLPGGLYIISVRVNGQWIYNKFIRE